MLNRPSGFYYSTNIDFQLNLFNWILPPQSGRGRLRRAWAVKRFDGETVGRYTVRMDSNYI